MPGTIYFRITDNTIQIHSNHAGFIKDVNTSGFDHGHRSLLVNGQLSELMP